MEPTLLTLSKSLGQVLNQHGLTISTAESCTGGLLSHAITAVSGSSAYFIGGVVAYSNAIKAEVLAVQSSTLEAFGAVSQQTACEMAEGIRIKFSTDVGLSTTGIAGPTGGTAEKPVGLVWMGISTAETTRAFACHFLGERLEIMHQTVIEVLSRTLDLLRTDN
ncbi:MAG: CinA family protein [Brevefilum sp.]